MKNNKNVEQALSQLEEIDRILQQDAQERNQEVYDRFMSLVHQKEGLIDHVKQETGKSPHWTPQGYIL
jgi:ClpP class serine protease